MNNVLDRLEVIESLLGIKDAIKSPMSIGSVKKMVSSAVTKRRRRGASKTPEGFISDLSNLSAGSTYSFPKSKWTGGSPYSVAWSVGKRNNKKFSVKKTWSDILVTRTA